MHRHINDDTPSCHRNVPIQYAENLHPHRQKIRETPYFCKKRPLRPSETPSDGRFFLPGQKLPPPRSTPKNRPKRQKKSPKSSQNPKIGTFSARSAGRVPTYIHNSLAFDTSRQMLPGWHGMRLRRIKPAPRLALRPTFGFRLTTTTRLGLATTTPAHM